MLDAVEREHGSARAEGVSVRSELGWNPFRTWWSGGDLNGFLLRGGRWVTFGGDPFFFFRVGKEGDRAGRDPAFGAYLWVFSVCIGVHEGMSSEDKNGGAQPLKKGKYKVFRTDLVSALSAFDRAQDWADLIHDLQRVNRVFEKHPTGAWVPEKSLLGKRLAQCLSPSLPSGVHLKALETYKTVFARLGTEGLEKDLPIYCSGLFPLLSYSSTSVKPSLVELYEECFLPIGTPLRAVLDGFVLALLPGLEDETSEVYPRVQSLLSMLRVAVKDDEKFATSLWRSLLLSPSTRISAATYLTLCYKDPSMPHPAPEILAPSLATALQDENVLVTRSVLDFLSTSVAPDSPALGSLAPVVAKSVLQTLLRSDFSLTKRVLAWLCGGAVDEAAIAYIKSRSLRVMLEAIRVCCDEEHTQVASFKALAKILLALLEREEIRICALDELVMRFLEYALRVRKTRGSTDMDNVLARVVEQFTPQVLLDQMYTFLDRKMRARSLCSADFQLLSFALSYVPTEFEGEEESTLQKLLQLTAQNTDLVRDDVHCLRRAVSFCVFVTGALEPAPDDDSVRSSGRETTLTLFTEFFSRWVATAVPVARPTLWSPYEMTTAEEEEEAERGVSEAEIAEDDVAGAAGSGCALLVALCSKARAETTSVVPPLTAVSGCTQAMDVRTCMAGIHAFLEIAAHLPPEDVEDLTDLITAVVFRCWRLFHPALSSASSMAAELWLRIEARFPQIASAVMADGMLSSTLARRSRNLERYSCLWRLVAELRLNRKGSDCGLFLMLDALSAPERAHRMIARVWLTDALLTDPVKVCDEPLHLLLGPETATHGEAHEYITYYDAPRALYAFQTLQDVIEKAMEASSRSHKSIVGALESARPSPETAAALAALYGGETGRRQEFEIPLGSLLPAGSYTQALAVTALGFIRARVPDEFPDSEDRAERDDWMRAGLGTKSFREQHTAVAASAAEFLATVLLAMKMPTQRSHRTARDFAEIVLYLLAKAVNGRNYVLQLHLIDAVEALLSADGKVFERDGADDKLVSGDLPCSAVEASTFFLPTVVRGLVRSARGSGSGGDSTGLRRRWISFVGSSAHYLGEGLGPFVEAVVGTMTRLLKDEVVLKDEQTMGSRENAHVDDRLLLLSGLMDITQTILSHAKALQARRTYHGGAEDGPQADEMMALNAPGQGLTSAAGESSIVGMNPLKFLNDLKDMIVGGPSDPHTSRLDPRQEALRVLFGLLPQVIAALVHLWMSCKRAKRESHPKEGSAALRAAIISTLEPVLRRHPVDLLASFIAYWNGEQMKAKDDSWRGSKHCNATMGLLLSLGGATPELNTASVCAVFELSLNWDDASAVAIAGKNLMQKKEARGKYLRESGIGAPGEKTMGRRQSEGGSTNDHHRKQSQSPSTQPLSSAALADGGHRVIMNAGEFFAEFHASNIQIASLEFLSCMYEFCEDRDDVTAAWPALYNTLKDVMAIRVRPSVRLELLNLLSSFAINAPVPLPDRRHRKELSHLTMVVATACTSIATGTLDPNTLLTDVDVENRPGNTSGTAGGGAAPLGISDGSDGLKRAHIVGKGMKTLAQSLPSLLDAAFFEDRPAGTAVLVPAVDVALKILKPALQPGKRVSPEPNYEIATFESARFLQECSKYDWSLKTISRGVIALLEDVNFFENKSAVLIRMLAMTLSTVLKANKSLLATIGGNASSPTAGGITAVFAGRDSEVVLRARTIHRISFCIFYGEDELYTGQVSSVLEKLRDSLRVHSSRLISETFLCLRVLLLRTGLGSVAPFRASTLTELMRILEDPFTHTVETMAALRFLDLVSLLRVPDLACEQCFFFDQNDELAAASTKASDGDKHIFTPLVSRILSLAVEGFNIEQYPHFRTDPSLTVYGGALENFSSGAVKAYATKLTQRITLANRQLVRPNLALITKEMEIEFQQPQADL